MTLCWCLRGPRGKGVGGIALVRHTPPPTRIDSQPGRGAPTCTPRPPPAAQQPHTAPTCTPRPPPRRAPPPAASPSPRKTASHWGGCAEPRTHPPAAGAAGSSPCAQGLGPWVLNHPILNGHPCWVQSAGRRVLGAGTSMQRGCLVGRVAPWRPTSCRANLRAWAIMPNTGHGRSCQTQAAMGNHANSRPAAPPACLGNHAKHGAQVHELHDDRQLDAARQRRGDRAALQPGVAEAGEEGYGCSAGERRIGGRSCGAQVPATRLVGVPQLPASCPPT